MKRFFKYELKKNFWTLAILSLISVAVYLVALSTSALFYRNDNLVVYNRDPQLGVVFAEAAILSAIVPMLLYSFKMNKRSVDEFYSLPIKREKMYLVKTLVGLLLVLLPYTLAYWLGFLNVCLRENYYHLGYYVPAYFLGLLFAVCFYGVNAFAFTRANRIVDGILFILFYMCAGALIMQVLSTAFPKNRAFDEITNFFSFGGFIRADVNMSDLIMHGKGARRSGWPVSLFLYPILFAALSYSLMIVLVRLDKGEDAEQNSTSWFGYKTMIPVYTILLLALGANSWLNICLIAVGALVMTIVYTRKILFSWRYWAMLAASVAAGIGLYLLVQYSHDSYFSIRAAAAFRSLIVR